MRGGTVSPDGKRGIPTNGGIFFSGGRGLEKVYFPTQGKEGNRCWKERGMSFLWLGGRVRGGDFHKKDCVRQRKKEKIRLVVDGGEEGGCERKIPVA